MCYSGVSEVLKSGLAELSVVSATEECPLSVHGSTVHALSTLDS